MIVRTFLGPPGTGKTTACARTVIEWSDDGVSLEDIAYMSFSVKAATEPVSRLGDFTDDDLMWFRTIHSAAFHMLGISREQVVTEKRLRSFAKELGFDYRGQVTLVDDMIVEGPRLMDFALTVHNVARNRMVGVEAIIEETGADCTVNDVAELVAAYDAWKDENGFVDFTDMLVQLDESCCVPVKRAIVDEAQDLSTLQWKAVDILFADVEELVLAGDDDQAVYAWAGADVHEFMRRAEASDQTIVLNQSYRVPRKVHDLASSIITRCSERLDKDYRPRDEDGAVLDVPDIYSLPLGEGEWLLLARNVYLVNQYTEMLRQSGYAYRTSDGLCGVAKEHLAGLYAWETLRKGKSVSAAQAMAVYDCMLAGSGYARGGRAALSKEGKMSLTYDDLATRYGLLADEDKPWFEVLTKIPESDKSYMRECLRNGDSLLHPRITVSTIHGAKGGEADNVALVTEVSRRVADAIGDDEHRVWYVAVTRAKDKLWLVRTGSTYEYDVPF